MARPRNCPVCGCANIYRAHRKPLEYLLLGYRAHLCSECKSRFLAFELDKILEWRSPT